MSEKQYLAVITLSFSLLFSITLIPFITAENIDISKIVGNKYSLQVDEQSFVVYYGYGGSLEMDVTKRLLDDPIVLSMSINSDHTSLEINLEKTTATHAMWIRLPTNLISADGGKFQVLIDGVEKGFDLTTYPDEVAVGYILPEGSQHVEIFGTYVIPEFGETSLIVFALSFLPIIYFWKKRLNWNVANK